MLVFYDFAYTLILWYNDYWYWTNIMLFSASLRIFYLYRFDVFSLNLLFLAPSGACEHRQRDVFRATRSWRLRHLLQPPGGPRPLLHHRLQLLRGDACRDISSHPEGHLVSATGATAAYCVELLLSNTIYPLIYTWEKKLFIFLEVLMRLVFLCVPHDASLERLNLRPCWRLNTVSLRCFWFFTFNVFDEAVNHFSFQARAEQASWIIVAIMGVLGGI